MYGMVSIHHDKKKGLIYLTTPTPPPIDGARQQWVCNAEDFIECVKLFLTTIKKGDK